MSWSAPSTTVGTRSQLRVPLPRRRRTRTRAQTRFLHRVRLRGQHGSATAETAMVVPLLVALTLALAWLLALASTQVRVIDAARETARAAARDESHAAAIDRGRRVAPRGAVVTVGGDTDEVVARVRARVRGPGGLLDFLPAVSVHAEAVTAQEAR